ncbi:MAG: cytochrome b N-terminal domain-containing protein [Candidatus Omnitrophica bacterium]|nr:cytochrome b N-terminal domain-containing protein [Candidatus Omnitrophota bacterium]
MKPTISKRLSNWINKRIPLDRFINWSLNEEIAGGASYFYTLGSLAIFLFLILIFTGILQMFYFVPSVDHAYASLNYLRLQIPFGWLIHGLHYWAANAFSVVVGLHVIRVFIWGAYKKPRELVWLSGVVLLFMVAVFMFTGPILPWDKMGYWAAKVGLSMAGNVPVFGSFLKSMFQGSRELGQSTLTRMFTLHVMILPAVAGLFILIHLLCFRQFSSVGPWNEAKRKTTGLFWPDQVFKDMVAIFLMFLLLVGLSVFAPAPFNGMVDTLDASYVPKPVWNFLFLYEVLKYFKAGLEPVGIVGVPTVLILLLVSLPFLDRSSERNPAKRLFIIACGVIFVVFVLAFTYKGYYSNPVKVSAGGGQEQNPPDPKSAPENEGLSQENIKEGEQIFEHENCTGCHTVDGRPSNKVGPDLLLSLTPAQSREWLKVQLIDPKAHNPYTIMPAYNYLSEEQASKMLDFLQFVSKQRPNVETPWTPQPQKEALTAQSAQATTAEHGRELFQTTGCVACHTANGHPSNKSGPDLMTALSAKSKTKDWLYTQLIFPEKHVPNTIMPSYKYLGEANLFSLVDYLETLEKGKPAAAVPAAAAAAAPAAKEAPAVSAAPEKETPKTTGEAADNIGDWGHGKVLYQDYCYGCHGPEGNPAAKNFSSPPGVPGLNPIASDVFNKDPGVFVKNVDTVIQHGSPNPSGPPMPAFGDEHSLTQAQIADIETYVLHINNVERAEIVNPGIPPKDFFFILLEISILLLVLLAIYWWSRKILL